MGEFGAVIIPTTDQHDVSKSHPTDEVHPQPLMWCFWIIFLILIPLSSVILVGFALFDDSITAFNGKGRVADILMMVSYIVSIYGIVRIILSTANSISVHQITSAHTKNHSNIVLAFIFILGVGDTLFIMTRFGDQLIMILNHNYFPGLECSPNLALSMIANFLKSLCQLCILMFILHQLNHSIKFKKHESKIFLTCLSTFCLIQWAQILLQEVHYHKNIPDSCDLSTTQSLQRFDQITPYLYPLGLEYRFACFIELLIMSECLGTIGSVISDADDQLTEFIRWLTFTASVIPIIQTILQLMIIWKVRRYNGLLHKGINQMWIMLGFAIWLFDTFSAKAYDTNEIQISVYSGSWDILAALFVPMSLFFRFHSCIMFANIKDGAYWDEEDESLV
ncbi:unnamed protein product [Adineta ricciae]|uniref:Uncharacterized protein n=1 Tax=Adineta ricciae TaxID=249248 RepID=A0A815UI79_ADIRI|nr:unnamed protein product [Adineta ricciae]